jgi:hypothetical protein
MRLDGTKLEELRRWSQGLLGPGNEERAAAGRAILMLLEEVERLRVELLRAREEASRVTPAVEGDQGRGEPLAPNLHRRLQRALRQGSHPPPGSGSERPESTEPEAQGGEATSPQAWIDSLRRQK